MRAKSFVTVSLLIEQIDSNGSYWLPFLSINSSDEGTGAEFWCLCQWTQQQGREEARMSAPWKAAFRRGRGQRGGARTQEEEVRAALFNSIAQSK